MIARIVWLRGCWLSLLLACGGGEGGAPPAGQPAAAAGEEEIEAAPAGPAPAPGARPQTGGAGAAAAAPPPTGDSTQLQREVFSYGGAGRDPFLSLLRSADVRPLVTDVRVTAITFDPSYPARSVAVLRDTAQNKRYAVRVGDELGRMRVTQIRRDAVVVTLDEFGEERQVVLPARRRQEEMIP